MAKPMLSLQDNKNAAEARQRCRWLRTRQRWWWWQISWWCSSAVLAVAGGQTPFYVHERISANAPALQRPKALSEPATANFFDICRENRFLTSADKNEKFLQNINPPSFQAKQLTATEPMVA